MSRTAYDLRDEPWIAVRIGDQVHELSLREVFQRAGEIRGLAGEIPTQDAAILRLLLVIVNRAIPEHRHGPQEWTRLWAARELPLAEIDAYLDAQGERFDLLSPTTPFLQVAGLSASKTSGLVKLIAEVPAGEQYFTTRAGRQITSLSYAEAARWLVHCQQFDVSGIKTGAFGDPRVKGGKGYPIGTGFAGRCGLVFVEGGDLRETLLLNLVLPRREFDARSDLPVWERPPLGPGVDATHAFPTGPNDLTTWSMRRILLHHNGIEVKDVLITNGDPVHARNLHKVEHHCAWRRSANQEKLTGDTAYMPRSHDPARALWRGLDGILIERATGGAVRGEAVAELAPAVVSWLADRRDAGGLAPDTPVRLHAVGMSYGTQDSMIEATYDDALRLRARVLTDPPVMSVALRAADLAVAAVTLLANLAGNLASAAGRDPAGARERAREFGFHQLDGAFRLWLGRLGDGDPEHASADWSEVCRAVIATEGDRLVREAGADAVLGRKVRERHLDAALADLWFRAALSKLIPPQPVPHHQEKQMSGIPTPSGTGGSTQ